MIQEEDDKRPLALFKLQRLFVFVHNVTVTTSKMKVTLHGWKYIRYNDEISDNICGKFSDNIM